MKNKIILSIFGLLFFACAPKVVAPIIVEAKKEVPAETPKDINEVKNETVNSMPAVMTKELAEGKSIYEFNCGRCHQLYEPTSVPKEKWQTILNRMQPKAKISDEETASIYNYLTSN
jgi:mono/diheme cytochrome c family protein